MGTELATSNRLQRAREELTDQGIDLLLVSPSADLLYLSGYSAHASERPTLLALRSDGPAIMLVAQLEAPRMEDLTDITIVAYADEQNPFDALADALGPPAGHRRIAISDQTWVAVLLHLQATFGGATFLPASPLLGHLRAVKSPEEIGLLREAGHRADAVFEQVVQIRFAGRTESQIAAELNGLLRRQGLDKADWGPIVASGPNSSSPHHLTGEREIHEGDAVVLDFGGVVDGYQADITRTLHVGTPSDEFRHVYEVVRQAQETGVQAIRPGVAAQDIDRVTRGVIHAAGYGDFFIHRTGHGIGLEDHEEPYIVEGNDALLEQSMTFSVEPGIYLPGKFGVRIEDIVALSSDGAVRLNHASRDLIVVH